MNKYYEEENIRAIANSLRAVNGSQGTYAVEDMADAVSELSNPTGSISITENGTYDVKQKASAVVNVAGITPTGTISITENGTVDVTNYASADVNVSGSSNEWVLPDGMKFGSYAPSSTTLPDMNGENLTTMQNMFYGYASLTTAPKITNTSNVTTAHQMFYNCTGLVSVPYTYDLSSCTNVNSMFNGCDKLVDVPLILLPSLTLNTSNMRYTFTGCSSLSNASLNNILGMCASVARGTSSNKKFTRLGLSTDQIAILPNLSNYQSAINNGWS